jgi:hypothetical protein
LDLRGSDGSWRKLHNEVLHNFFHSPYITRVIISKRNGWDTKRLFSIKWSRKLTKQQHGRGRNHEETRERRVGKPANRSDGWWIRSCGRI